MKLSIIICVYNTDKAYLEECLTSIFGSTLSDYEVIFVDDGSTVDYSDIVSKYKVKYSKTDNNGHFAARLHGIEKASGEYITFVDSDDTVSKNYHFPMVTAADKYNADIVINSWAFRTDRTRRCCISDITMSGNISVTGEEILPFFTACQGKDHSYFVQWNKVFRREMVLSAVNELKATGICDNRLTYAEDVLLSFFYFKHAKKVVNINSGFYFYRIHSSQTVNSTDKKKLITQIECMSLVLKTMFSAIPECEYSEKMKDDITHWKELISRTHYSAARGAGFSDLYPLIKEKYGIQELKTSKFADGKVYINSELLGENFTEIDNALTSVYMANTDITVNYDKSSTFVSRIIYTYSKLSDKKIEYKKENADISIPVPKNRITDKIVHSKIVYTIGLLLFKKGSRMRNFLKRHL